VATTPGRFSRIASERCPRADDASFVPAPRREYHVSVSITVVRSPKLRREPVRLAVTLGGPVDRAITANLSCDPRLTHELSDGDSVVRAIWDARRKSPHGQVIEKAPARSTLITPPPPEPSESERTRSA